MTDNINDRLNESLDKLRELVKQREASGGNGLITENKRLQLELANLQKEHQTLVKTSEDVINELNNAIEVIDNFFKK